MFKETFVDHTIVKKFLKFLDTIDKKALLVTTVLVGGFLSYIYLFSASGLIENIKWIASMSHESTANADVFCARKANYKKAFCADRRAAVNDRWREVGNSGGRRGTSAFSLRR